MMIRPRFATGANTADLGPTTILTCPERILIHSESLAAGLMPEWIVAAVFPKRFHITSAV